MISKGRQWSYICSHVVLHSSHTGYLSRMNFSLDLLCAMDENVRPFHTKFFSCIFRNLQVYIIIMCRLQYKGWWQWVSICLAPSSWWYTQVACVLSTFECHLPIYVFISRSFLLPSLFLLLLESFILLCLFEMAKVLSFSQSVFLSEVHIAPGADLIHVYLFF